MAQVLVSSEAVSKSDEKVESYLLQISKVNEKIETKEKALSDV